jgi:carbonic anhydrase
MKTIEITYRYGGADWVQKVRPADAEAARRRLDAGSRTIAGLFARMAEGADSVQRVIPVDARDLGLAGEAGSAPAQRPYAAVLGCADARVPIELIFNEGPNDLFVVRVAGNGLGPEVIGSLRYAAEHLGDGLRLFVVLGHSGCGAVSAAVDVFMKPQSYLAIAGEHALRGILDRLIAIVHAAARRLAAVHGADVTERPGYREALIETVIVSNAALSAYTLQQELCGGTVKRAAYGVWLLASHEVWAPRAGSADCAGVAYPPADLDEFIAFGEAVVRSERISALIARGPD